MLYDYGVSTSETEGDKLGMLHLFRLINNTNWTWKALRLLARRSPYFFAQSPYVGKSLAEYLTVTITKLATELPVSL